MITSKPKGPQLSRESVVKNVVKLGELTLEVRQPIRAESLCFLLVPWNAGLLAGPKPWKL